MGGTHPKWMVIILENPIKMDDLGVPHIFGNTHICCTFPNPALLLLVPNLSQKKLSGGMACPKAGHEFPGGGNSNIFYVFFPKVGEDYHFDEYFSKGLVQPPTRFFSVQFSDQKLGSNWVEKCSVVFKLAEWVKSPFWPFEIDIYVMWNLW